MRMKIVLLQLTMGGYFALSLVGKHNVIYHEDKILLIRAYKKNKPNTK